MKRTKTYFTTRDLLMMAALAALGGVVSTYVNAIGDFMQSILGFAGTTQWAAGLHVLWLTLAVGLTRKQGAGTMTGILKGGVELLTGNTHGLLIVLVDVVAGLMVDLGFLPFRSKDSLAAYCLAGGLAAVSNVFVFQLFASVPADTLAYWAMLLVAGVALLSGVLFGGVLSRGLVNALRRAGVVKDAAPEPAGRRVYPIFLVAAFLLTVALAIYLRGALRGPETVHVGGAVDAPYDYPVEHGDLGEMHGRGHTARGHGQVQRRPDPRASRPRPAGARRLAAPRARQRRLCVLYRHGRGARERCAPACAPGRGGEGFVRYRRGAEQPRPGCAG